MTEDKPLSERPLHVRVAEALGWKWFHSADIAYLLPPGRWQEDAAKHTMLHEPLPNGPGRRKVDGVDGIYFFDSDKGGHTLPDLPRYDTSWEATGPLIEKYGIELVKAGSEWIASVEVHLPTGLPHDEPYGGAWTEREGRGPTPLIAVCHLLLALAEAGKLEER